MREKAPWGVAKDRNEELRRWALKLFAHECLEAPCTSCVNTQPDWRINPGWGTPRPGEPFSRLVNAVYKSIHRHGASPWTSPVALTRAVIRNLARRTGTTAFLKRVQARLDRS